MSALHSAFTSLGPEKFSNVPTDKEELDNYISNLFEQSSLILESVPPPPALEDSKSSSLSPTGPSLASSASEISLSSARSDPPSSDFQDLQKQWGKPIKLNSRDNPLGMSVYKTSGKDGRGAWFARRSVHEGLSFAKWKQAFEREFAESMEAGDKPGEGNIRGIGGERRVEDITIEGKGRVEVYQLSAQFPGPTTPRDFITMLITSSTAMKTDGKSALSPRHYMIISKPCEHDECPPRDGYIRGQYESVEFIREVPRKASPTDSDAEGLSEKATPQDNDQKEDQESELNPVEWIMITRSDPGGSVPKFMVERGTPASICGDAVKFLDWATRLNHADESDVAIPNELERKDSLPSWETNGIMSSVQRSESEAAGSPQLANTGMFSTVTGAVQNGLEAYAPQAVLDYIPRHTQEPNQVNEAATREEIGQDNEDARSSVSSVSFASAESHVSSDPSLTSKVSGTTPNKAEQQQLSRHEKELQKLREKRLSLDAKMSSTRERASSEAAESSAKEIEAQKKAEERLQKDLKKQEERYKKEVAKLEAKHEKEVKKMEQRKKKAEEKDLNKQNDNLKKDLDMVRKENDSLLKIVGDLQAENTKLTVRIGDLEKSTASSSDVGVLTPINGKEPSPEISHDQVRQLLDEEKGKGGGGRFRGLSVGSQSSGKGSVSGSRASKDLEKEAAVKEGKV